jgi:hypothetical protein
MRNSTWVCVMAGAGLLGLPAQARGQMYELVGTRAQGMGGAFVAVADDATASWWNPAGLAAGSYFSLVVERARTTDPEVFAPAGPASRGMATGFAVAFPALGISYYRLRLSEIRPLSTTGAEADGRQEEGGTGVDLRALRVSQYGVTVGQSIGPHLVVASTVKLVRAGTVGTAAGPGGSLERADELDVAVETKTDLDAGVMASLGRVRLGLSVRHLREPSFGDGAEVFELSRQARAGIALTTGRAGPVDQVTAAFDADLTRTATPLGEVRHVVGGVEAWLFNRRVGLRGGLGTNTIGERARSTSAGLSVALQTGFYVDGAATFGSDVTREGWALGVRVTF